MGWPIYIVGTMVASFIWSAYDAHGKQVLNEHGEYYNEETGTWQYPEPILPDIGLNERGESVKNWFEGMINFEDEKKSLLGLSVLAIILFSKPWK